jgi:acetylornithine/succinyldiaminopimelate/putrescine aminotransferase
MVVQRFRGLWPGLLRQCEVVGLEPNDADALDAVFREHGSRIAGFWAEPVMMNREALALDPAYLARVEVRCREAGALLCMDEIQTGFWLPEMFEYRRLGLRPDLVVVGKGLTAGFHPLSGLLLHRRHDVLEQYDAISTNGSAALPALVALASIEMIEEQAARIRDCGGRIHAGFQSLVSEFPETLSAAQGRGHLAGLKFRSVEGAIEFHRRLLEAGLWTRVHAYHEGHSTLLTKLGLLADAAVIDGVVDRMRDLLRRGVPGGRNSLQGAP